MKENLAIAFPQRLLCKNLDTALGKADAKKNLIKLSDEGELKSADFDKMNNCLVIEGQMDDNELAELDVNNSNGTPIIIPVDLEFVSIDVTLEYGVTKPEFFFSLSIHRFLLSKCTLSLSRRRC